MTLEIHMELLRKAADTLEQRFISPVYLVGSFHKRYRDALDIDLIMVMSEKRAKRIFDDLGYNERRFRFNTKQKLWIENFVSDFDIDFKVQLEPEFDAHPLKDTAIKLGKYAHMPE